MSKPQTLNLLSHFKTPDPEPFIKTQTLNIGVQVPHAPPARRQRDPMRLRLHPMPYILCHNPGPYALSPESCTLYPTPYALHQNPEP